MMSNVVLPLAIEGLFSTNDLVSVCVFRFYECTSTMLEGVLSVAVAALVVCSPTFFPADPNIMSTEVAPPPLPSFFESCPLLK